MSRDKSIFFLQAVHEIKTIVDIKINSKKDLDVDTINPEASQNPSLQYVVMLEIETEMTRSELENTLEPDYKILKLKEV